MRESGRHLYARIASGITGLLMLVFVLFSAFYIIAEAEHDCSGEDCRICAVIQVCENALRRTRTASLSSYGTGMAVLSVLLLAVFYVVSVSQETPVSRRVRLNN